MFVAVLAPAIAFGHGMPVPLAQWGEFSEPIAHCQRAIGRAGAWCSARVLAARTACLSAQARGEACDAAAVDAAVTAVRSRAAALVEAACSDNQARVLQFVDRSEAVRDVTTACREAEAAAVSAVFGPALVGGSVAAEGDGAAACLAATARAASQLLRLAFRLHERALDAIAAGPMSGAEKQARLDAVTAQVARARALVRERLRRRCSDEAFQSLYLQDAEPLLTAVAARAACFIETTYAQDTVRCAPAVCGNGMQERGEECDDGNDYAGDGCKPDCTPTQCEAFNSTFDLIQQAIFERHGCTSATCHGNASAPSGGLDLRAGHAYANLIDVPAEAGELARVLPGDQLQSMLWLKLAAKTFPQEYQVPLSPMPLTGDALSADEIEALRLWIHGGAPQTGTVPGTGERLHACLPEPDPLQVRPPPPPAPGEGVQLHMPRLQLAAHSEQEVCFASYYDLTSQVPAEFLSADGQRFRFNRVMTTQNPLSHHMVVLPYKGNIEQYPPNHAVWGTYRCAGGPHDGEPCDAVALGACGEGFECATVPRPAPGCVGYGPPDAVGAVGGFGFAGAQETVASIVYADGVYGELPLKGVVVWNSHAFNVTRRPGIVEGWVNLSFAPPDAQRYVATDLVDISAIFNMNVPAFETRELCQTYTLPDNTHLFDLSSHTHRHGKRFRIFRGQFTCAGGPNAGRACSPLSPALCGDAACLDPNGRTAERDLLYASFIYSDPVVLRYDPPLVLAGAPADRTFTYCSLYDNGATDPNEVKRQSTSPRGIIPIGGPCATPTHCMAGTLYAPCAGATKAQRDQSCDSSPGAGDGLCDACTLLGGITTEDEMFVLLGRYFLP